MREGARKDNMDYHEFIEKSGWDVTEEEYEQYILPTYMKGPSDIIGIEVTLFCQWLNDNGFTMKQLKAIAPIMLYFDDAVTKNQALQSQVRDLEADLMLSRTNEDAVERRLRAVLRCYGEDDVCQRMVDDIPTDQIIDMYARAKAIQ